VAVDAVRMNQFFLTQKLPQNELDFDIFVRLGVPKFSFITDASGLDKISLSFVKMTGKRLFYTCCILLRLLI
jgi:hypothetical protein